MSQEPCANLHLERCGGADEAFKRSGMVVLVVESTPAGEAVLETLQGDLRFLTFGFRLPPRATAQQHERSGPPCRILSFGIRDDPSFDVDAALSFGCVVHMFDHTVPPAAQRVLSNLHHRLLRYYPIGLTAGESSKGWAAHAGNGEPIAGAGRE